MGIQLAPVTLSDGSTEAVNLGALNYFIDASTFQVLMTHDISRPGRNSIDGPPHEVTFSDCRYVGSVLVSFNIKETQDGQTIAIIQLNQMKFNSGLTNSNFQF